MLSRYVGGLTTAAIADYMLAKKYLTVVWVRRIFNSICMFGPAVAMIILAFNIENVQCNLAYVVSMLCIGMFTNGALSSGHFASYGDLSPNFAGSVFGISNTISGGSIGFIVPLFIGAMTSNMTFNAWSIVFATAAVFYIIPNIVYIIWILSLIHI